MQQEQEGLRDAAGRWLARPVRWPRFTPALEARYERDTEAERCRHMVRTGSICTLISNGLLLSDRMLIPDVFRIAVLTHLALTGLCLLAIALIHRRVPAPLREGLVTAIGLAAVLATVALFSLSRAPEAGYYFSNATPLLLVSVNTFLRVRFGGCLVVTVLGSGAACFAVWLHPGLSLGARMMLDSMILGLSVYTAHACYFVEIAAREGYLRDLLQRLAAEELVRNNALLGTLSQTDWLTDLLNRRAFHARLAEAWAHALADGGRLSLVMIDVDHFKAFNDTYGHPAGDACLVAIARIMLVSFRREQDLVARYGGEEFAAVLPNLPGAEVATIAERFRGKVEATAMPHAGAPGGRVTVSLGIATMVPRHGHTMQDLINAADAQLYRAKREGRNRVCGTAGAAGLVERSAA